MAQKISVTLVDDIDGGEADRTLTFAVDGSTYEIDLSEKNATAFNDALAPYISAGRRTSTARSSTPRRTRSKSPQDVRRWARENGHQVPDRGRIPAAVQNAYDAAH